MKTEPKGLSQRYAGTLQKLKQEILRRKTAEEALKKNEEHFIKLLKSSTEAQERFRHLSHQIILAQEEERKVISRELHDDIAQTLSGINVNLASLKVEAAANTNGLKKKIARTQHLVEKSVNIVHRFARDLRPTLLDDLGLVPALRSYIKSFTKRTGITSDFKAFVGANHLDAGRRTALYRVAQAALTNVDQHAEASIVKVSIEKKPRWIHMAIADNGRSFEVEKALFANKPRRLGLLGMRERIEMLGGILKIESVKGIGTTVKAQIPLNGIKTS